MTSHDTEFRSLRARRRFRLPACHILLLSVAAGCASSPSTGQGARKTTFEAEQMRRGVAESRYLFIGNLAGRTSPQNPRGPIYTLLRFEQLAWLKGPAERPSAFQVAQLGGTRGSVTLTSSGDLHLRDGGRYLVAANDCRLTSAPMLYEGLVAPADTTEVAWDGPLGTSFFRSFHSQAPALLAQESLAGVAARANASIRGVVSRIEVSMPASSPEQWDGRIELVAVQSLQNLTPVRIPSAVPLVVQIRPVSGRRATAGTAPLLREGDDVVLFLERSGWAWRLVPSAYAAWQVVRDSGTVRGPHCACGRHRIPLATASLESLATALAP